MAAPPTRHRESEVRDDRPRRLLGISLLPAAATLGNLLCGFAAIFFCLLSVRAEYAAQLALQPRVHPRLEQLFPTHVAAGAYLIVLAMFFDALDGRLARLTRRTSEFGAQLDSIADIVSFGIAPAILVATILLRPALGTDAQQPDVSRLQFRMGMAAALVYVSCAAIRLARFNAENVRAESGQKAFSGLPSPGAAALVVALIVLHESLRSHAFLSTRLDWPNVSRWIIIGAVLLGGVLMVSRLDYVHVFNVYARRKHPPSHLVWLVAIIALGWYWIELLLVALAVAYVLSGIILHRRHRARPSALDDAPQAALGDDPEPALDDDAESALGDDAT